MDRFVAPTLGELRCADLPQRYLEEDAFEAVVLSRGSDLLRTPLRVTELWQARVWVKALECPRCLGPAQVLRASAGFLLCGRCLPPKSAASKLAKTRRCAERTEAALLRSARRGEVAQVEEIGVYLANAAIEELFALQGITSGLLEATSRDESADT